MEIFANNDKSVHLTDLASLCQPQSNLSKTFERGKWGFTSYETNAETKGTLISAREDSLPEPVTIDPGLTGWYAIFVGLPELRSNGWFQNTICIKMTSDEAHTQFAPQPGWETIEEVYWKCADMTNEQLTISKYCDGFPSDSVLAWLRFVPLTEEEVANYQADQARTDTKRLYMTHDMHGFLIQAGAGAVERALDIVENNRHSDCEWLSLENIMALYDGDPICGDIEKQSYLGSHDLYVHPNLPLLDQIFEPVIDYAHRCDMKVCISHRMGAWCLEYPDDGGYFNNKFFDAHPELRCVDRNGAVVEALSYAYPEVQDHMIKVFLSSAAYGPDALEMMFHRGVPYVLFEEPVQKRFAEKYPGVDMRLLAVEDPRVLDIHCEIMTEFVRRLRTALDRFCEERGVKIGLHARGLFSLYDSKVIAVDLATWAKEGLISAILSTPTRIFELLPDEVWEDSTHTAINLEKYTHYVRTSNEPAVSRASHFGGFREPRPDHLGILRGPKTQKERIQEFMELERNYGVVFYPCILPRYMPPAEYQRYIMELHECGVDRFSFWDAYSRSPRKIEWSMISRLGHKDELASFTDGEGTLWHKERIIAAGGKTFSHYSPSWAG